MLLNHPQPLAQVMGVTQGVSGLGVVAVLREPVVDRDAREGGEHTGVVEPVDATSVVDRVDRREIGARGKHPPQPSIGPGAGLVEVHYRRAGDLCVHLIQER